MVRYGLTSANDSPERDPCTWTLEGLLEGEGGDDRQPCWQELDQRADVHFTGRHFTMLFDVARPARCRRCVCVERRVMWASGRASGFVNVCCLGWVGVYVWMRLCAGVYVKRHQSVTTPMTNTCP